MAPLVTVTATAAVIIASAGAALAAPGHAPHTRAPACTDTFILTSPLENVAHWNVAKNWTHGVPTRASDVCVDPHVLLLAPPSVAVHSLEIGGADVAFGGHKTTGGHVSIATVLIVSDGGTLDLHGNTLTAPSIADGHLIDATGNAVLTSPALTLGTGNFPGEVAADSGTLTVTDPPAQLINGTLTGGIWDTGGGATLQLPSGISALAGTAEVAITEARSKITDAHGGNALAGLASIATGATLTVGNGGSANVAGNLTSGGMVLVGSTTAAGTLTVGGSYTETKDGAGSVTGALNAKAVSIGAGATLDLNANFTGPVSNAGTITLTGKPTVTGDYTQAPSGVLSADFTFGGLVVTGKATLAGTLQTGTIPRPPAPGSRATLMTFGSHQGTFTSHSVGFNVTTSATQVVAVAQPQITAPAGAPAGGTVTVSGGDFQLGATVKIFLDKTSGTPLATATSGVGGVFQQRVTIPAKTGAGTHTLIAVASDGSTARQTIQVTG